MVKTTVDAVADAASADVDRSAERDWQTWWCASAEQCIRKHAACCDEDKSSSWTDACQLRFVNSKLNRVGLYCMFKPRAAPDTFTLKFQAVIKNIHAAKHFFAASRSANILHMPNVTQDSRMKAMFMNLSLLPDVLDQHFQTMPQYAWLSSCPHLVLITRDAYV